MCTRQDVCQPLHEAYSWKSCLGKGTTLYFNFMVFFLYKASACTLDGWNTFTVFFKYLYWSFFGCLRACGLKGMYMMSHMTQIHLRVRGQGILLVQALMGR